MLRHKQDARSLVITGLTIGGLLAPHFQWMKIWLLDSSVACLFWISLTGVLCFIVSIINHNHMHCRIFRQSVLNVLLNLVLSLARGHTATGIVVPHHLNHHMKSGTKEDWIKPGLAGDGIGWIRLIRFIVKASANMMICRTRHQAPSLPPRRRRSHQCEKIVLCVAIIAALFHDWQACLLFNVTPWLLGLAMLVGVNLLQHDDCLPALPFGESRNFTGALGNWVFFNNGFHTAHHWHPSAHWSELPILHAALASKLPRADLENKSVIAYLWRFVWSRTARYANA